MSRTLLACVLAASAISACAPDGVSEEIAAAHQFEASEPPPLEKPGLVVGEELNVRDDAQLRGQARVDLQQGQMVLATFTKRAGAHYTVGLSNPTGDLDLYGYWARDINPQAGRVQYRSIQGGLVEDQIDFSANEDGAYYLLVYAYRSGAATLQLFESPPSGPRDEVGWPVFWGDDAASEAELVGGGFPYLARTTCVGGARVHHPGYDFNHANDNRSPVTAVAAGVVVDSTFNSGYGNAVLVEHELTTGVRFRSMYGHLSERHVSAGDPISKGDTIGLLGTTGASTGPHLHFEIRTGGAAEKHLGYYPCGWTEVQTREAYPDPGEFIRVH